MNSISIKKNAKIVDRKIKKKTLNYLNTSEALIAKKEIEEGRVKKIGSLQDMDEWMDKL